jgi:hypothetical protein
MSQTNKSSLKITAGKTGKSCPAFSVNEEIGSVMQVCAEKDFRK